MSLGKILGLTAVILFTAIAVTAFLKNSDETLNKKVLPTTSTHLSKKIEAEPLEVELDQEIRVAAVVEKPSFHEIEAPTSKSQAKAAETDLPEADRVEELFSTKGPKLPIVETITYKSRVAWQKGRPAWLSDYASHYDTTRHFIARSLNNKPDYLKQDIAEGDRFNVLKIDKPIQFHLVVDTSRCKMWFYYIDQSTNEKVLLKTYLVSLGRPDSGKTSGLLTPLGKYTLGNRKAIYKPSVIGHYKGQKVEMIKIFGTRWIPFDKEVRDCTEPAKGFGIHGVPWIKKNNGELVQDLSSLGKYESDGCIRMASEDVEEIFAILSRPTVIELVKDFHQSEILAK